MAVAGLGCATAAAGAAWLLLTDPLAVTSAVVAHDFWALVAAGINVLRGVVVALLW
jgi:hypothetical protein